MTIWVELNPETEARLKAEARAKGLPLEKATEELLKFNDKDFARYADIEAMHPRAISFS